MVIRIALAIAVSVGLWGASRLSYDQFQSGEACPILGEMVPACYIALGGYLLIAAGSITAFLYSQTAGGYLFWTGLTVAGALAAFASVLELIKGDVCPVAFGSIPMCYLSLAFTAVIGALYWMGQYGPAQ